MNRNNAQKAIRYLKSDAMKHLSTLKCLSLYAAEVRVDVAETAADWAVAAQFPAGCFSYDRATYPQAETAVFINGTSAKLKQELLLASLLPQRYVLKLNDVWDTSVLESHFHIARGNSFISYSCLADGAATADPRVSASRRITAAALDIISRNGYSEAEISKYFAQGALWFGVTIDAEIKSICFIYPNYEGIWEIAGLHTREAERNKGYGKMVTAAALQHILSRNFLPRYVTDTKNTKSIELAQSLNLKPFLQVDHFLLDPVVK